ncbi:ENT domain-containing protein [Phthorimaea operculella]|nr:ENT domain-containing protein [Phthorimaea operculella]
MWPMLLNMTRDECRRTLRRLELEAYSNIIGVFRAQGALEDNRKKLLEELRAVLHISNDRHSAEARRVSNDELLATIAEQLAGPNTGLAWISEGRRRVPLLPRGVAQTMYTELADKAAEAAAAENAELQKKLEAEKLIAPKSDEVPEPEGETAEADVPSNDMTDEISYPPVAMEDQSAKLWETELLTRKRKIPEGGAVPDEAVTPVKNMRNIPVNTNQKHLNLSQIYSKFSQPATSKSTSQSKHSYNQVSKVSTSKSNQGHAPQATPHKPRAHKRTKNPAPIIVNKSQVKKPQVPQEVPVSPSKYNPVSMQLEYGAPNTFQASYAQAVLGAKPGKPEFIDDLKQQKVLSTPGHDAPAMQLVTQPATTPHELGVSETPHPDDPTALQAQTPNPKSISGKPCHLIIKNKDISSDKKVQIIQKQSEGIKLLSNKQVVVASSATQKALNTKIVATKVIGSVPRSRGSTPVVTEKMIVVSKPAGERSLPNSKIIITSSTITTPKTGTPVSTHSISHRTEAFTPKGLPAPDLKVSAKAVVLNQKSGQKMVVLPAKARTKSGGEAQIPVVPYIKGMPTSMKLVPVSPQVASNVTKQGTKAGMTVVSKPVMNAITPKKIIGVEPIKTANLADIVPVKGMTPVTTPKITNPIVRPVSKGNVIVVQKGATIGKALKFTNNGNDMNKIIMGKNVNQLLQASKPDQTDVGKSTGNVIVLELNNEQSGRTTTMSEILDSRQTAARVPEDGKKAQEITQDTPVLFENQMTEETCNASSLDSTAESISDIVPMEEAMTIAKEEAQSKDSTAKDSSSVTDWEMELETPGGKEKDDDRKLNALHLDLGMSSEEESDYMGEHKAKSKHSAQGSIQATPSGESSVYSSGSGMSLATRTLLSQLQDDGDSSNDSSFALKAKRGKQSTDRPASAERDALTKVREKLNEKVAKSAKRIDIYSTAITSADINLDAFSYLEEGMMDEDEEEKEKARSLHDQLSRLLGDEDSQASADSQSAAVSESLPLNK